MSRIACLRIPLFQIAAQRKYEPALKGKPLVLMPETNGKSNSTPSNQRILVSSKEACDEYIFPGMRLSEAKGILSELVWRHYDSKLYREAQQKIANELLMCSPRVSVYELGSFLLDAQGLMHMGGENKFCRNVLRVVSTLGYTEALVGIADSAFTALVATRVKNRRWFMVPSGKDKEFQSGMPLKYLPLDEETQVILKDLGVTLIGQFAKLPAASVSERFGEAGRRAHELALGIDRRRPSLPQAEKQFQCSLEIGGPVEALNDTLFVFKALFDRLTHDLRQSGLCADELIVSFFNDDELFDERPVKLIRPSHSSKFLLEVVRLSLETKQLAREFTGVRVAVSRYSEESWEQSRVAAIGAKDDKADIFSESSMLLLQRLITRFGDKKVVRPQASDDYFPAGHWMPVIDTQSRSHHATQSTSTNPVDVGYILNRVGASGLTGNLALRVPPDPIAVLIQLEGENPISLAYAGQSYRINLITTPECVSGGWWESYVRKSYYVAVIQPAQASSIAGGLVVSLVHEHRTDGWFIEGVYD